MSSTYKNNIEITIFGESHGKAIGVTLGNLPAGIKIDFNQIKAEMLRRVPGKNKMSTQRVETDEFEVMSGICEGFTTGAPLMAMIKNQDQRSKDYSLLKSHMRPSHSDYPAYIKYHGFNDVRGGGHFSGRLTAPIVFAGALAKQILKQKGIFIGAHMKAIGQVEDQSFNLEISTNEIQELLKQEYPVIDSSSYLKMQDEIENARINQDSIGGKIECAIIGMPAGVGEPFFDSVESHMASLLFSIPAVKGIHFGNPLISTMRGSQANDQYFIKDDKILTSTNHNGGITGGITNGMPIVFTVMIKPTPTISQSQKTVDVSKNENTILEVHGRHDPCIVPRAIVVVEAMAALSMLDHVRYL